MEFEGIVLQVLPEFRTQTQRGEFVKQEVVFEQPGEFTRKVCVGFTGDRAATAAQLKPGEKVKISFNVESREWNGRWFTEVRGWKIEKPGQNYPQPQGGATPLQPASNVQGYPTYANQPVEPSQPTKGPSSTPDEVDDLPF